MIEWSAVLAMALNAAPATVVILLVIWRRLALITHA